MMWYTVYKHETRVYPGSLTVSRSLQTLLYLLRRRSTANKRIVEDVGTNVARNVSLVFDNRNMKLHSVDPFTITAIPSEKVAFRDVLFECSDDIILDYFNNQHSHIMLKSRVIEGNIHDHRNSFNLIDTISKW